MTLQIKVKSGNSLTIKPSSNFRIAVVAAVVVVAILTWVLKKELLLTDGNPVDNFGWSVALDGNRALVGAIGRNGGVPNGKGSAYIFDLSGGVWSEPTDISLGTNADTFDYFGYSVALDGSRALVGARGRNGYRGAAYIFDYDGTTWNETTDISLGGGGGFYDYFGQSVALDGNRALVGAPGHDSGFPKNGSAYIFDLSGGVWSEPTDISLGTDGSGGDSFGNSVALDGSRAIVGAPGRDGNRGAAYIFDLSGGTWSKTTDISLGTDANPDDEFGYSVALDGSRALVGVPGRYNGFNKGTAYIFDYDGTTWSETTDISLGTDGDVNDYFGYSVALDGNRALVGAHGTNNGLGTLQGSAYIFDLSGGAWSETKDISLGTDGSGGDYFGYSVALDGNRALVGAIGRDDHRGAAYIYDYERTN